MTEPDRPHRDLSPADLVFLNIVKDVAVRFAAMIESLVGHSVESLPGNLPLWTGLNAVMATAFEHGRISATINDMSALQALESAIAYIEADCLPPDGLPASVLMGTFDYDAALDDVRRINRMLGA